jgi:hypothetical protein
MSDHPFHVRRAHAHAICEALSIVAGAIFGLWLAGVWR